MLLSALGFIPVVGIFADIVNGVWYWAEGDYFSAIGSFISAVPMIGDTVGIFTTTISGCTKAAKIISYGTRMFAAAGNMALGVYQTAQIACDLYDKHHNQGLEWDSESTSMAVMGVIALGGTAMSAFDLAKGLSNFDAVKYDIETSQCFVAGTLVLTDEGNKPIEEIKAGDFVYSTNPETGESGYKEVVRAFRKESDVIIHIFVNGEEIETTPSHPFWVENEWVSAKDLREGDILTLDDGSTATITKTYGEKLDEPVIVYNFEVKDFHTYYVTDIGVLVHNANQNNCGVVEFRAPPDATESEIDEVKAYVDGCNEALAAGKLSETGRVPTKGELRQDASIAARQERARASAANTPYSGVVGHVPDTTWTGNPNPYKWQDLSHRVNSSLGGQSLRYPIGYQPTKFIFKGD